MSDATLWWVGAGILVAAELVTGTFYLLMLALGAAAAALAAHLGVSQAGQLVVAAIAGGGAITLWHFNRPNRKGPPPEASRDLNLDIGSRVRVEAWASDGTARVQHRGAAWDARYTGDGTPAPGEYVIRAVEGACLILGH